MSNRKEALNEYRLNEKMSAVYTIFRACILVIEVFLQKVKYEVKQRNKEKEKGRRKRKKGKGEGKEGEKEREGRGMGRRNREGRKK